ncbi:LOW QUALITY PROTEIN: synaptotagmin-C-like [Xenia sp. Carnegie-2017]|uniref:LOW QUALITY PROTEIN: synaptotagmin-C-like n=1 Tax=Xenia sp. Carnegie-2017 TaxID=2897299 RepID=UPI001F03E52D|nr:LOW QUALITY PROTEIN: synaptotagmin-C-like [Xenia sp. Carnegie-2017]
MTTLIILCVTIVSAVLIVVVLISFFLYRQSGKYDVKKEKFIPSYDIISAHSNKLPVDVVETSVGQAISPAAPTPTEFFGSNTLSSPSIRPRLTTLVSRTSLTSSCDEIDPSMYEIETIDDNPLEPVKLGSIQFSLLYDSFRNILTVTLLSANDLVKPRDTESKYLDPYVTLSLQPEYHHLLQSKVQQKTRSPVFNENFEFEIMLSNLESQTLCFSVFNFLTGSRHSVVGQVSLPLADLQASVERTFSLDLQPTNQRMQLGEILFSLGYLRIAGRLTLIVMKARNLPSAASVKGTDAYVKVTLIQNGRRTKKKKTSTKKNKLNPVFNEAVSFDIASESLDTTDILLTVIHDCKIIGCVLVGANTNGKESDHWRRMKVSDKPVAEWHVLQDGRKYY